MNEMELYDRENQLIREGFYVTNTGDIYFLRENEETFVVEDIDGQTPIDNLELFARQLIHIKNPKHHARFILSK